MHIFKGVIAVVHKGQEDPDSENLEVIADKVTNLERSTRINTFGTLLIIGLTAAILHFTVL